MRRVSKKRRKLNAAARVARLEYLLEHRQCMCCRLDLAVDVHEISRGAARASSIDQPCTWLAVCRTCNTVALTNYDLWPVSRQLALKLVYDRENFDLDRFNQIRGRAPGAITQEEVMAWINKKRMSLAWLDR